MAKNIRNRGCVPNLNTEGIFLRPLGDTHTDYLCLEALSPFERMNVHHTLASARRYAFFKSFPNLIPRDQLDFVLNSNYNHSVENFPDPIDVYLQNETLGKTTWRRLRNTSDLKPSVEARANILLPKLEDCNSFLDIPYKYNTFHPVIISGISERRHPSNVKLINSSHHSPQTNAGFSRQPSDGNVYQY